MPEWAQVLHQSVSEKENLESRLFATDRRIWTWANADISWDGLFWNSGPVGMIQHDDFWDLVSKKVNIYRSDIPGTSTATNSIISISVYII